jgi:hypothetical protein
MDLDWPRLRRHPARRGGRQRRFTDQALGHITYIGFSAPGTNNASHQYIPSTTAPRTAGRNGYSAVSAHRNSSNILVYPQAFSPERRFC